MALRSLPPMRRLTISSSPSSVAKRQRSPARTMGMGTGHASSPITSTRRSGLGSCSTRRVCMAARIFARVALAAARSELTTRSLCSSPKIATIAESLSALSAAISASTAASGVAKVSCGAAAAASGAATISASASRRRNDQKRMMFMGDALLFDGRECAHEHAPGFNDGRRHRAPPPPPPRHRRHHRRRAHHHHSASNASAAARRRTRAGLALPSSRDSRRRGSCPSGSVVRTEP